MVAEDPGVSVNGLPLKTSRWQLRKFPPLVYDVDEEETRKKETLREKLGRLQSCISDQNRAMAVLEELKCDVCPDDCKKALRIEYLRLRCDRMLGHSFLGYDRDVLFKIQTSCVLNVFVPLSWVFGVLALFLPSPGCQISVSIFASLSFVHVGIRLMGLDMVVWRWLLRQFHHFYKVLQGVLFAVSFCFISKFPTSLAIVYGFSCFLWIWFICSIDAFMMPKSNKTKGSVIITAATFFLSCYVVLSSDINDYSFCITILPDHSFTISMSTICINSALQIFLLSVYSIWTLIFFGESSVNILIQAPLMHCIYGCYETEGKVVTKVSDDSEDSTITIEDK